jgi:outer membrane protein
MFSAKTVVRMLMVSAGCALAAPMFGQLKVGIINVQKAVTDTAEIKKASAELEAKFKPRQEEMSRLQGQLQDIQKKLSTPDISPQAQAELTAEGQRKQRSLQRLQEDVQGDVDRERNEILGRTGERMREVITKLAEAKGLDVVMDASTALYSKPSLDITADATTEYNKAYPVK